ncbi:arylamine N-acetyltransferase family protein [Streptomyces spectabilis]|uniref:Arylamine N-acetyltransferase n=1 Tax=Streptomyces spectabilis TaxID=68270 RepID=A0A5P2X1J7_STRST|nr:arylamine N-acetyltransferase [Streptomyces spectabilis]MBB5101582.1 N-hydroxyarylamine O-acetyltransferase [Streptomyces spectabilis]MCI3900765.1 arylamine N-acetyltransferase [Streptomyces spectabilis]QEV58301.1 arylamine N-acetyltransferase [Streptomyces spectabilis]GGV12316.1 N-hydroxyarylamine O-acetyltransferase [Streptomyces spectabilis]
MDTSRTDAYLLRIGAERPAAPTSAALRDLHLAHLRTVPFENLAIHAGEEVDLVEEDLLTKVVDGRRGGFCYELNGAFAALLTSLGFEVEMLQAGVYQGDRLGIPYDHMALRVRTADGGDWLADVGFGKHSHYPLAFGERGDQSDPGGTFRVAETPDGDLRVLMGGEPQYLLDPRPRALADFTGGAWYHRTSPKSHFTRSLVCSILTETGRATLSGSRLTVTPHGGEPQVTELATDADVLEAYATRFGIALDAVPRLATPVRVGGVLAT